MTSTPASTTEFLQGLNLAVSDPERVLICTQESCQYALQVRNKRVSRHLWEKHHIPKTQRRGIDQLIDSLRLANPRNVPVPVDGTRAHPLLKKCAGYACRRCSFRTISSKMIQQHVSEPPTCSDSQAQGLKHSLLDEVWLQSWVREGVRPYWIVRNEPEPIEPTEGDSPRQTIPSRLESILDAERTRISKGQEEQITKDMTTENAPGDHAVSPWLYRTRWHQTYSRARRDILVKMTLLPTYESRRYGRYLGKHNSQEFRTSADQEHRIDRVLQAVQHQFFRCEETVKHTPTPILCWLYSQHPLMSSRRPFQLLNKPASRTSYIRVIKKCFNFLILAYLLGPDTCESLFQWTLTEKQNHAIAELWDDPCCSEDDHGRSDKSLSTLPNAVGEDTEYLTQRGDGRHGERPEELNDDGEDDDDGNSDSDYSISDLNNADEEEEEEEAEDNNDGDILRSAAFSETSGTPAIIEHSESTDILVTQDDRNVYRLAELVLKLSVFLVTEEYCDGSPAACVIVYFSGILGMTSDGSAYRLIRNYTSNLAALVYFHRLVFLEWALPYREYSHLGWPRRLSNHHLSRLKRIRQRYTCYGCLTPFTEFMSLVKSGLKLAHTEGATFQVRWDDDGQVMSYNGDQTLSINEFRTFAKYLVQQCLTVCEELMYRWKPVVEIEKLRDDWNNTHAGYSFVHHPTNRLSGAYLELCSRACTASKHGLMVNDRWVLESARRYLKLHDEGVRLLLCLLGSLSGQAPRSSELLELQFVNAPSGVRDIFVHQASLIWVCRRHKSRHLMHRDFVVVRKLPHQSMNFLYYYLVYIRPFYDMILRECHLGQSHPYFLFAPQSRAWTASELTRTLRHYTDITVHRPLNVRLFRQLSIAIAEKHVRPLVQSVDPDRDRAPTSILNAVLAWQSGHRPYTRSAYYGRDAAFPSWITPTLIDAYLWASSQWHRFLDLDPDSILDASDTPAMSSSPPAALSPPPPAPKRILSERPNPPGPNGEATADFPRKRFKPCAQPVCPTDAALSDPLDSANQTIKPQLYFPKGHSAPLLYFHREHHVMICIPCGRKTCTESSFIDHFRHTHRLKGKELQDVTAFFRTVSVTDLTPPLQNGSSPVPYLSSYVGFKCLGCGFLTINRGNLNKHCAKCPITQGLDLKWRAVKLQTWSTGRYADYWIVKDR
jgi:hypothetical protein